jgi:periplasmic protein CpxP/Spy
MRNTRKMLVGLAGAMALAASAAMVYAQPYGPGAGCQYGGGPGMMGQGPGAGGPGMMGYGPGRGAGGPGMAGGRWSNPEAAVEGHLAALKVELKITPDQDAAWQAFTAKAKQQADTMRARREQMFAQRAGTTQSAPERLAQRTEFAKQGLVNMESMTAAVKDLYAALTPEQKAIADQRLAMGPMGPGPFARRGYAR